MSPPPLKMENGGCINPHDGGGGGGVSGGGGGGVEAQEIF